VKNMKKVLILIISIIILVIVFAIVIDSRTKDEYNAADVQQSDEVIVNKSIDDASEENKISLLERVESNAQSQKIDLQAVDVSDSFGTAYRLVENGKLQHAVVATMPDLVSDNQYEGWLVQSSPLKFFSTGVMQKNESGEWILEYEAEGEFPAYLKTVITLETQVDAIPEKHIIEGDF
jgi:uncharacterized protein YxeA